MKNQLQRINLEVSKRQRRVPCVITQRSSCLGITCKLFPLPHLVSQYLEGLVQITTGQLDLKYTSLPQDLFPRKSRLRHFEPGMVLRKKTLQRDLGTRTPANDWQLRSQHQFGVEMRVEHCYDSSHAVQGKLVIFSPLLICIDRSGKST